MQQLRFFVLEKDLFMYYALYGEKMNLHVYFLKLFWFFFWKYFHILIFILVYIFSYIFVGFFMSFLYYIKKEINRNIDIDLKNKLPT